VKELLELESAQNLAFERTGWRIERAGWVALALLLAAALAGVLGPGPLATRDVRTPDGALAVSYPRFMRMRAESRIRIRLRPPPAADVELRLDGTWLAGVRVRGIAPAPTRSEIHGDRWSLVFATPREAATALEVSIDVEPRSAGRLEGGFALGDGAELRFHQLVYP
jgi:hypothetical protein